MKAYDKQVGGGHYKKMKIQPMQYSMANELDKAKKNDSRGKDGKFKKEEGK